MGQPPLERITEQIMLLAPRKGLDQQFIRRWDGRMGLLRAQPILDIARQLGPGGLVHNHGPHPSSQMAGHRKFRPAPARDLGRIIARAGNAGIIAADALKPPDLAAKQEGIPGGQLLDIPFLDLANLTPAAMATG